MYYSAHCIIKTINNNNMLGIGDNFDYQGKKPNFARDCFSTLEKMKSYPETSIDPGHISFCGEDGKLYQYLPDNEINEVTGKWRRLVDSILDANSENPVQNKVVVKKISDLEKLIAGSAEKVKGDIDLDIETMGGIIAAGMVDLNRNMDELEEAVSEAINSLNAGHVSLEEIKVNGHPITSSVNLNSTDIGLGNVDNTRDLDKPISTRVSAALNEKVDKSIKVNNKSLAQDVVIEKSDIGLGRVDNTGDMEKPVSNAVQQALDDKVSKVPGKDLVEDADIAKLKQLRTREELDELVKTVLQTLRTVEETHTGRKDNPHSVTKDQVGLGSVDDTSDLDKPISHAVEEALGAKVSYDDLNYIYNQLNDLSSMCSELSNTLSEIEPISRTLAEMAIEEKSYGVKIDFSMPNLKYTSLGNQKLHETLPVQNKIKPCILNDDGQVVKYLPIDSGWSDLDVDGRLGQVMVEIPEFWYYMENNSTDMVVRISEGGLPGFKKRPKSYISAYNATIDRELDIRNNTSVRRGLCSVCSNDPRYEGGLSNNINLKYIFRVEGYNRDNRRDDPDVYKQTFLGKPFIEYIDLGYKKKNSQTEENSLFLTTIRNPWHPLDYPMYLSIFFLYVTEFKSIDLVSSLNLDNLEESDNFIDESLMNVTDMWNSLPPVISPKYIGDTNTIGGRSGVVQKTFGNRKYLSIRYRGMENLVGDIAYCLLGFNNERQYYLTPDNNLERFVFPSGPRLGPGKFILSTNYGILINPSTINNDGGSNSTYFKSTFNIYSSLNIYKKETALFFGAINRTGRGSTFNYSVGCKPSYLTQGLVSVSSTNVFGGTRLCYYPPESQPTEDTINSLLQ